MRDAIHGEIAWTVKTQWVSNKKTKLKAMRPDTLMNFQPYIVQATSWLFLFQHSPGEIDVGIYLRRANQPLVPYLGKPESLE